MTKLMYVKSPDTVAPAEFDYFKPLECRVTINNMTYECRWPWQNYDALRKFTANAVVDALDFLEPHMEIKVVIDNNSPK
jgi:hypothetical protein